ncbi:MAG: 2',3'-cyclic-nucleotide 2'-phosphodiesterase (5'-nucleotidase family) [Vicingaceae bacterium]|jgi:2',3'-cyclic-nucleotide 2'-phosphodiesterase (5'-nucleotidase family)
MKKFYTFALLFTTLGAIGQTTFYTESFESSSGFSYPNGNGVGTSTQDFFDRTDSVGAPLQEVFNYTGFNGSFFIAGEDIDGALTSSLGQVYLDNIDISGKSNLQFTAAFASGTNIDIDGAADSISVEVRIDNGNWVVVGRFRADSSTFTSSSGPFNGQFAEDTNGDGYGDGTRLTGNFTDFSWPIMGSGDSLDVRISMDLQSGDEEAAFDHVRVSGSNATPSTNYTLQILHASDLEGGVKAITRAKYFAALVDTLEGEYANSITLSAGDNYIPGPFFNASGDLATFRTGGVFNNVYNRLYNTTAYDGLREAPGRADISIMNIIGFDASAMGNHEFDAGLDAIEQIIEEDFRSPNGPAGDRWVGAQFPYLSSNLDFSLSGDLSNLYSATLKENTDFISGPAQSTSGNGSISKIAAATYISRGGEKIGVVGATTPIVTTISSTEEVTVTGPTTNDMVALAAEIQPWIDSLRTNQAINKIILVTHLQQLALEEALAGLVSGVDIIIAGGSDAILANANDRLMAGDVAVRPYPILTPNADGDTLAIVSTNGEYSYVGRLVVQFDGAGKLIPSSIDSTISGPYISDSAMVATTWGSANAFANPSGKAALVDSLALAVQGIVVVKDGNILGKTEVYLNGERASVRTEETNYGNLTADANLIQAQQFDPSVRVSIKNGGGIRAAIGEVVEVSPGVYNYLPPQANPLSGKLVEEVSQLDIENSLRFNNLLSVLDLTASGLKDVLEHGVAAVAVGSTPGQFAQVGGVRFSYDPKLAAGSRIISAIILDNNGTTTDTLVKNGVVFGNGNRTIKVVTLNFLAGGGDSYPFPTLGTNRVDLDTSSALTAGASTFAPVGSEQDALAEYLTANFSTTAYDIEDTDISEDSRIENVNERADDIFGVSVSFDEENTSVDEAAGSVNLSVNYNNQSGSDREIRFRVLGISTTDASDYTIANLTDTARANTNGTFNFNVSVNDDAVSENDEVLFIELDSDSTDYYVADGDNAFSVLFIRDNDNVGPIASKAVQLKLLTSYRGLVSAGSTEILAYDSTSQRLFVTNSSNDRVEILDFSNPSAITRIDSIDISNFGAINSVAVQNGIVACAIQANSTMANGTVAFYDTNGVAISNVTVGVLPDMVVFSPDGNTVMTANEGEPDDTYTMDPEGSISIIDISGGVASVTNSNVTTLGFASFNSQAAALRIQGVRLFGPGASVAQDMEPEYVAISADNTRAYVACQENNAVVIVDLVTNTILSINALGTKDHSLPGNGLDSDRRSDEIHIAQAPFQGFYMPDAIAPYEANGNKYFITANEGDSRDYGGYSEEDRLDDLTLDPTIFPNEAEIFEAYGDIKITTASGDIDNDGDYDVIHTYGARSFTIWDGVTGNLVYDSGDDFEQIIKNHPEYFRLFNVADDDNVIKNRSDDKGPEPEAVTVGIVHGVPYAFIGMERTGGVMVYDITNPASPTFVEVKISRDTATGGGDQAPEGLIFIPESQSPTNRAMLISANEASNTLSIWEVDSSFSTSVSENIAIDSKLTVYPNPAAGVVYITSSNNEVIQVIEVLDSKGSLIQRIESTKKIEKVDVTSFASDVYILRVTTSEGIRTSKLIVK